MHFVITHKRKDICSQFCSTGPLYYLSPPLDFGISDGLDYLLDNGSKSNEEQKNAKDTTTATAAPTPAQLEIN